MKRILKIFLWIVGVGLVFYLGIEIGLSSRFALEPYRQARLVLKLKDAIEDIYRQDTYGGATPEETFSMFLDALKKGDTALASKYFILDKQDQWRENLETIKANGHLDEMVEDLNRAKKNKEEGSFAWFYIPAEKQDNNQSSSVVVLEKNNLSGVWKISVL